MPSDQSQLAARPVTGRIDSLDSIRGLAALAVLLSHFCGVFVLSKAVNALLNLPVVNIAIDGKAGVAMFFVLSGFVLARPYLRTSDEGRFAPVNAGSFYLRRITRIYIPFLFVLLLSAAVRTWLFRRYTTLPPQSDWFSAFWCCPVTAGDILKQCGFLLHDGQRQMLNQDWSLGVELKASFLLPIYVFLARKSFPALAAAGLGLAIFMGTGHYQLSFVMGVLLAYFIPAILPKLKAAAAWVRAAFFAAGVLAYGTRLLTKLVSEHSQIPVLPEKIIWTITALGCVAILLAALSSRRLDMVLNHPGLTFLGRISYSVYLLHFMVLLSVVPAFVHGLNLLHIQNGLLVIPAALSFMLLVTIAASALCYQWIEIPSINLGRRLCPAKGPKGPEVLKKEPPVPELEEAPKK